MKRPVNPTNRSLTWDVLAYPLVGVAFGLLRLFESVFAEEGLLLAGLFDAAHILTASLLIGLLSRAQDWFGRDRPWVGWAILGVVVSGLGFAYLGDDLDGFCRGQQVLPHWLAYVGLTVALSLSLVLATWVGRLLDRSGWRWTALAFGMILYFVNGRVLQHDYRGIHLFVGTFCVMLCGSAFRSARGRDPRLARWPTLAAAALLVLPALVLPPTAPVGALLSNSSGAAFSPIFTRVRHISSERHIEDSKWWSPRDNAPPLPPSSLRPLGANPLVILVTVDALRADVVLSGKYDKVLPTLARLRDEGLSFTQARAPGTLTKTSLASLFMGTYFSQQYWSPMKNRGGALTVHADGSVRFPEILKKNGIKTDNFRSVNWLRNGVVMRGFRHDEYVEYPTRLSYYTPSPPIIKRLISRLKTHLKSGHPAFLYTHLTDPHAPYDQGKLKKGDDFSRYLSEVELVDTQLAKLVRVLEKSSRKESILLIVSADHGEAFGEHNAKTHGTTMYDEALRVPLVFFRPGTPLRRRVDDLVSLIDLGPTILDLFENATPGHMMGQSLVPYLNGASPVLDRPVFAETRLMRTFITQDRMKLIEDTRTGRQELYNLEKDPHELENLADNVTLVSPLVAATASFFEVHTLRRDGYKPPFVK